MRSESFQIMYIVSPPRFQSPMHTKSTAKVLLAVWFWVFKVQSYECWFTFFTCSFLLCLGFLLCIFSLSQRMDLYHCEHFHRLTVFPIMFELTSLSDMVSKIQSEKAPAMSRNSRSKTTLQEH